MVEEQKPLWTKQIGKVQTGRKPEYLMSDKGFVFRIHKALLQFNRQLT